MIESPTPGTLAGRVIIVLGGNRTGTTWLVQLLGAHPTVAAFDVESAIFDGVSHLWENAQRTDGEGISAYLTLPDFVAAARSFCDSVFLTAIDQHAPGTSWFVEKSPPHVHLIPLMAAVYPDAWYIHIVRDGRDVARSVSTSPFGPEGLAAAAQSWGRIVRQVRRDSWRLPRFREVRYEELFADPIGGATQLFEWMGLPVDDDVVATLEEHAAREVSRYQTGPVGPGKWRQLPPADIRDIELAVGDTLAELGYTD
jgi:hypothetical protein